jgi:hypothetical protein
MTDDLVDNLGKVSPTPKRNHQSSMIDGVWINNSDSTLFDINNLELRVVNIVKKSILCKTLWFLKVINSRGIFEGLNDIFSQSKSTRIESTLVHYISVAQLK